MTLKYFLREFISAITLTDTKFLRSLKLLFIKPGFLSKEYVLGRRNVYTRPLTLFLISNLIYFLLLPIDTFNTPFQLQMSGQIYSGWIKPLAKERAAAQGISMAELQKRYDARSGHISKLFIILIVFFFSIPLSILFFSRKRLYYHHLVFSLHFTSFIMYFFMLLAPVLLWVFYALLAVMHVHIPFLDINSTSASLFIISVICIYLVLGLRRFYDVGWLNAIIKAVIISSLVIFVVFAYRLVLFMITLAVV